MRLAIDVSALTKPSPTGVERYVARLIEEMKKSTPAGVSVTLLSRAKKPEGFSLPENWVWRELSFFLPKGWTHLRLPLHLMRAKYDLFFQPAHEIPLLTGKKTKVVTTIHDVVFLPHPEVYSPTERKRQKAAIDHAVRRADHILCVSQSTADDLTKYLKVDPSRLSVTRLASDALPSMSDTSDLVRARGLTPQKYLLTVGRRELRKDHLTLLRAFEKVKDELGHGHPLRLVVVGKPAYGAAEFDTALRQSRVKNDVEVLGYVDDQTRNALMQNALAFVFPSVGEGFGLPLLETMSLGVPLITSDIPPSREVAADAALYAPVADVAGFAHHIRTLLFDPSDCRRLSEAGLLRAKEFTWSKTAGRTWGALRIEDRG